MVLIQDGDISKQRVVDDDDSIAGFIYHGSIVGIGTHIAGTVAATIDIMVALEGTRVHGALGKFKELLGILIVHDTVDGILCLFVGNLIYCIGFQNGCSYLLEFLDVITDFLAVCQGCKPGGDIALDICLAVPYPGTAVYLHLGVTQNVGVGSLVGSILLAEHGLEYFLLLFRFGFCVFQFYRYTSIATAIDILSQFSAFHVYQGVAIHGTIGTTAIYVVPDEWNHVVLVVDFCRSCSIGVDDMNDGITVDASHLIIFRGILLLESLTAAEYFAEDIATFQVDEGLVVCGVVTDEFACLMSVLICLCDD